MCVLFCFLVDLWTDTKFSQICKVWNRRSFGCLVSLLVLLLLLLLLWWWWWWWWWWRGGVGGGVLVLLLLVLLFVCLFAWVCSCLFVCFSFDVCFSFFRSYFTVTDLSVVCVCYLLVFLLCLFAVLPYGRRRLFLIC